MDLRSKYEIKADAIIRMIMHQTLSGVLPIYIVTEYQKSGGTWVGQMLAEYLELPFPRNRLPILSAQVLHGHLMPKPFIKNILCVFRDGRDTAVSSYYHMLFESDKNSPLLVRHCRNSLKFSDYNDVRANMPRFIEYLFTRHHVKTLTRRNQFTWGDFVDAWNSEPVVKVKYEDLIENCVAEMSRIISMLIRKDVDLVRLDRVIRCFSFEKQSKRKPGQEDTKSFLRKGKPGDWREKFNREAAEIFDFFAGEQLIKLGYEPDHSWVEYVDI